MRLPLLHCFGFDRFRYVAHTCGMGSEVAEAVAAMIASRAEERRAAHARSREAAEERAVEAEEFKERRRYGLAARHARKLARLRAQGRLV